MWSVGYGRQGAGGEERSERWGVGSSAFTADWTAFFKPGFAGLRSTWAKGSILQGVTRRSVLPGLRPARLQRVRSTQAVGTVFPIHTQGTYGALLSHRLAFGSRSTTDPSGPKSSPTASS